MLENIIILGFIGLVGYGLYKVIFKKETPAEAANEIKNEVVAEEKKVEEAVAPVVVAEVAKIVEEAKAVEAKVEQIVVTEVAKVEAAVVAEAVKVEEIVVAEVAKVEEVVVTEVKKAKARVKKAADVNQDGKVDAADVKAAAKKVAARVTKPKKTKT